jgi:hypothetical protein
MHWVDKTYHSSYDASKHRTMTKNKNKLPWTKVVDGLLTYLETTKRLFQRTEIMINPERRIQGVKIEDAMVRRVYPQIII